MVLVFAGVNLYRVGEEYKFQKFEAITSGLTTTDMDTLGDEDSIAFGFGLGVNYLIPNTNFGVKFAYNRAEYDGRNIHNAGT